MLQSLDTGTRMFDYPFASHTVSLLIHVQMDGQAAEPGPHSSHELAQSTR